MGEAGENPALCRNGKLDGRASPNTQWFLKTPEQEVIMKLLSILSLLSFILASNAVQAQTSCVCTEFPANLPVVGLFHKSDWGTSALELFRINENLSPEEALKKAKLECEELRWKLAYQLNRVCPRP